MPYNTCTCTPIFLTRSFWLLWLVFGAFPRKETETVSFTWRFVNSWSLHPASLFPAFPRKARTSAAMLLSPALATSSLPQCLKNIPSMHQIMFFLGRSGSIIGSLPGCIQMRLRRQCSCLHILHTVLLQLSEYFSLRVSPTDLILKYAAF